MEIYVSIDGVLRNTIQKFDYHYNDYYLLSESEDNNFEYGKNGNVQNDNLLNYYKFQSKEEFENFLFIEFPVEIFGLAGISYSNAFTELNKLIYENKDHNFYLIGLDELGKSKPATLFFLSKNGCLCNNIKFINSDTIDNEWNNCDVWITDNKTIIDKCPENKLSIKFNTNYNNFFDHKNKVNKINEICLKSTEKTTPLTLTESPKNVEQAIQ
jgi:hypothetical protein